jgi:hypothetical protein
MWPFCSVAGVEGGHLPLASGVEPFGHVVGAEAVAGVEGGHLPLASGVEPSGQVCCCVDVVDGVFSAVDGAGGGVLLVPPLPVVSLPPVVVPPLLPPLLPLSLLLPPPPLLSLLLLPCFFANTKFTLLPVTKPTADSDDTSVSTRNTKIIFLAA